VRTSAPARKNESTDQKVLGEKDSILLYGHRLSRIESLRGAIPERIRRGLIDLANGTFKHSSVNSFCYWLYGLPTSS